jgi:hypothetical protein
MPDLSPAARKALAYWPQIEEAAHYSMTTADLWETIHAAAEDLGLASPGVTLRGVSELRSLATQIQASGRRFESLGDESSVEGRHVSDAPWSRPLAEREGLSIFQVRYQHTTLTAEGPETNWRTSIFYGQLPGTKAELQAALEEDAGQLANKYNVSHISTSGHQILAV